MRNIRLALNAFVFTDTYIFSLRDQLTGIELGNDALQNFIHNGWQDALVIVQSEFPVDGG
jgi:hypothetical protein